MVARIQESWIVLKFRYDQHLVAKVKSLPKARFDPSSKVWYVLNIPSTIMTLKKWGFQIEDALLPNKIDLVLPEGLHLYRFQEEGVKFLELKEGRALIADEQGLGKTIQALSWLRIHPELRPVVIVCPNSVKLNWYRESRKWLEPHETIHVIFGKDADILPKATIYIINYDILLSWLSHLKIMDPMCLIIDETHMIKNRSAKRTRAVIELSRNIKHIIGLSGTPIVNRPIEGFTILNLIAPKLFPKFWDYAQRYCGARWTRYGWDFSGATNTKELYEILTNTIMIRRKKVDVLDDLPSKIRSVVPIEFPEIKNYSRLEREFRDWLKENKDRATVTNILAKMELLRQFVVDKKLPQVIEWISDFLESSEDGNGKIVVFYHHKMVGDKLYEHFKDRSVRVDGETSVTLRQKYIDQFQSDPKIKVFFGNIQAAGTGITLTAASSVAFVELPWTPALLDQAEDRCHRIGQKSVVNVYYLVASGTVEEDIATILDQKRAIITKVLDGQDVKDDDMLLNLLVQQIERREDRA